LIAVGISNERLDAQYTSDHKETFAVMAGHVSAISIDADGAF
jgi:hypothetical protein